MSTSLLAAALVASACGGSDAEQAPAAGRESFEGTELRVLLKEGYEIEAIQEFLPEFEEATGIEVELEVYDEPTARQKLVLDATSGTGTYDVTSLSFWNVPEFVKAGWVEPLDAYIEDAKDEWLTIEDIPPSALDSMTVDDKLYALPHTILGGMFFYRADVFEELGLQPPQTTDEILAAAEVIAEKRPDLIPFTGRGAPTFASLGTELGWAHGYGALLFDEDGTPQADSPEMTEAMTDFVTLMRDYGPEDAASLTFTEASERFSSGQAAMTFDTSGFGTIFEDPGQSKVAGNVGYTLPTGPAGNHLQWLYNEGLAVTSGSENKNAAWLFLQWRVSRDTTMKELTELGRTDVPNLHVLASPEYAQYAEENGLVDFTEKLQETWKNSTAEHWPFYPEFAKIGDTFSAQISSAIADSMSVEESLETAQTELTSIMESAGYLD
ncbi:ABC transporter substrate-binding protein [Blastococcus atacamensis]|uniref:ABC transporter substrate-binding protein n=1 Tax=Blastococcus atacamensis TaxID=2070508 RepID=UPI0012FFE316|nr:sugar ABC transporter substrate-binding protein [Blastococcus atacamensis]